MTFPREQTVVLRSDSDQLGVNSFPVRARECLKDSAVGQGKDSISHRMLFGLFGLGMPIAFGASASAASQALVQTPAPVATPVIQVQDNGPECDMMVQAIQKYGAQINEFWQKYETSYTRANLIMALELKKVIDVENANSTQYLPKIASPDELSFSTQGSARKFLTAAVISKILNQPVRFPTIKEYRKSFDLVMTRMEGKLEAIKEAQDALDGYQNMLDKVAERSAEFKNIITLFANAAEAASSECLMARVNGDKPEEMARKAAETDRAFGLLYGALFKCTCTRALAERKTWLEAFGVLTGRHDPIFSERARRYAAQYVQALVGSA